MTKDDIVANLQALFAGSAIDATEETNEDGDTYFLISADGQESLVKWRQDDVNTVEASGAGEFDIFAAVLKCQIGEQVFNATAPGGELIDWLETNGVADVDTLAEFMIWNGHSDGAYNAGMMRQLHRIERRSQ
jgi:hypothetical protein